MAGDRTSVGNITIKVNVDDHTEAQMSLIRLNVKNALKAMANATLQRSQMLAPLLTGALRTDGRVESTSDGFEVVYGSGAVPYARYQEFGADKKSLADGGGGGKQWNYTTPGTGAHYLENAFETVKKEGVNNYL